MDKVFLSEYICSLNILGLLPRLQFSISLVGFFCSLKVLHAKLLLCSKPQWEWSKEQKKEKKNRAWFTDGIKLMAITRLYKQLLLHSLIQWWLAHFVMVWMILQSAIAVADMLDVTCVQNCNISFSLEITWPQNHRIVFSFYDLT